MSAPLERLPRLANVHRRESLTRPSPSLKHQPQQQQQYYTSMPPTSYVIRQQDWTSRHKRLSTGSATMTSSRHGSTITLLPHLNAHLSGAALVTSEGDNQSPRSGRNNVSKLRLSKGHKRPNQLSVIARVNVGIRGYRNLLRRKKLAELQAKEAREIEEAETSSRIESLRAIRKKLAEKQTKPSRPGYVRVLKFTKA